MTDSERPAFDVVIVAAGESRRMGGVDKLEAPIGGRPLLAWTIDAFAALPEVGRIVVVTAADRVARYEAAPWRSPRVTHVVAGGARRQESVAAGVRALARPAENDAVILIHDGARPAISPDLIRRVTAAAAKDGAAIPVLPLVETVKEVDGDLVTGTVDRNRLATAQTPQAVRRSLLERAWERHPPESKPTWTDEAALLEACTITVHAVSGDPANLKVTLPSDLMRAESILLQTRPDAFPATAAAARVGLGQDSHPFGPGRPLALGGVEFPDAPRLHGHSDGDVALHAVADALLGAAGLPDLGRMFPADASTPVGIASTQLLERVVQRLAEAGLSPRSVDVTIVGARPHLGTRLDDMRQAIAGALGLDVAAVNVKASSGNLSGPEGAGRVMSASSIATVRAR